MTARARRTGTALHLRPSAAIVPRLQGRSATRSVLVRLRSASFAWAAAAAIAVGGWSAGEAAAETLPGPALVKAHAAATRLPGGTILRATADPRVSLGFAQVRPLPSFLGVSYEFGDLPPAIGFGGENPVFPVLLNGLARFGGGPPSIRIGGASTDDTFYRPVAMPNPLYTSFGVTPLWLYGMKTLTERNRFPLIVGLNLILPDPELAAGLAEAVEAALPDGQVISYQIGNEPDLYGLPRGIGPGGALVQLRASNYSATQHAAEFYARAQYLRARVPGLPLAGPDFLTTSWAPQLPTFVRRNAALVNAVTLNYYPLCVCQHSYRQPGHPTLGRLLSSNVVLGYFGKRLVDAVALARRYRKGLRLIEVGSIAGGGGPLGGTFASALWGADFMLGSAAIGVRGLNFHTSGTYTPFAFGYFQGVWRAQVNPLYYAMLFYARATANHARFLPVASLSAQRALGTNVSLWSTVDPRGTVRVAVLNKSLQRSGFVQVRIPRGFFHGSVVRLLAPSALSKTASLAGQHFPDLTTDGRMIGRFTAARVTRGAGETYRIYMHRASGAILTVGRRQ